MPQSLPLSRGLLSRKNFPHLLDTLKSNGYRVVGPIVRDGAIVWDSIMDVRDLPLGWQDQQQPGQYRLERSDSPHFFGVVHGPDSLKRQTFAPREKLLSIERTKKTFASHCQLMWCQNIGILNYQ